MESVIETEFTLAVVLSGGIRGHVGLMVIGNLDLVLYFTVNTYIIPMKTGDTSYQKQTQPSMSDAKAYRGVTY